ncbi:MAG TPA: hypothetical protein VMM37_02925 [Bacteroidota bacterium]|nr:hypothetical protein [Bacteroidota bacterium]
MYQEPASLFVGTVVPDYRWGNMASTLWIHINIRNTFDETLQGRERLTGTLEVILAREPHCRKTVALINTSVVNSTGVTRQNGQVTINRGDTLKLLYVWDFWDDNGNYLPTDVFHPHGEPGFPDILESDPELFIIRGSFQVFDKNGQLTFQQAEYVLTYYY